MYLMQYKIDKDIIKKLKRINSRLPSALSKYHADLLGYSKDYMIQRLRQRNNVWRGTLINSIRVSKRGKYNYSLLMSPYGTDLDQRPPHGFRWVKLKKSRLIHQWALDKGSDKIKDLALKEKSIVVRKHPFIARSALSAWKLAPRLAEKHIISIFKTEFEGGN